MTVTISRAVLFGGQESLSRGGHIRKLGGGERINRLESEQSASASAGC